jgi:hypothetical protein
LPGAFTSTGPGSTPAPPAEERMTNDHNPKIVAGQSWIVYSVHGHWAKTEIPV